MSRILENGEPYPERENPSECYVRHSELGLVSLWMAQAFNVGKFNETIFRNDDTGAVHLPIEMEGNLPIERTDTPEASEDDEPIKALFVELCAVVERIEQRLSAIEAYREEREQIDAANEANEPELRHMMNSQIITMAWSPETTRLPNIARAMLSTPTGSGCTTNSSRTTF
jgi:hypothetical protein